MLIDVSSSKGFSHLLTLLRAYNFVIDVLIGQALLSAAFGLNG